MLKLCDNGINSLSKFGDWFLYCPSCSQSFGSTYSRCPECHCWLKSNGPPVAVTTTSENSAQAEGDKAQDGWGWSAPSGDVSQPIFPKEETKSGWAPERPARHSNLNQGAATPRPGESTKGWLNEHTLPTSEENSYGWTPDPVADTLDFPLEEEAILDENDWVDEDLDDYDDYSETASALVQTPVVDDTVAKFQWALLVAICLFFVSLAIVKIGKSTPDESVAVTTQVEEKTEEDAALFLNEAENNLSFGKHTLAASQFGEAVAILEKAGAEPSKIQAAKAKQARALTQAKELKTAHALWAKIPGQEASAERKKVAKELRVKAAETLKASKKASQNGNPRDGEKLAKAALADYRSYGGNKDQITKALDTLAYAYLQDKNTPRARIALKEAQGLKYSQERQQTLRSLEVTRVRPNRNTSKPDKPNRPKRPPSIGEASTVPTAERPRGTQRAEEEGTTAVLEQKSFEERAREANAQYVPPASNHAGSNSSGGSRPGKRDELEVYNQRSGSSKPPGY